MVQGMKVNLKIINLKVKEFIIALMVARNTKESFIKECITEKVFGIILIAINGIREI
jgi:hypothetical protein